MINDVKVKPLKQISDDRGKTMHMLRNDSEEFRGFGEIYFSTVKPGKIKGWHIHKQMILNYTVPHGNIKLVLFDNRPNSPTKGKIQEIFMGDSNYCLVTIPPMVWNGFTCISKEAAIVVNCASIPHDPNEIERLDPYDPSIPYDWSLK